MSNHRCVNLDYQDVKRGRISCIDCDRTWLLTTKQKKDGSSWNRWVPSPCPGCRQTNGYCKCNEWGRK